MARKRMSDQLSKATRADPEDVHTAPPKVKPQILTQRRQWAEPGPRKNVNWKVDAGVANLVGKVAEAMNVSPAAVATCFIYKGLAQFAEGALDFDGMLYPSRGPKYKWVASVDAGQLAAAVKERLENE